MGDRYKNNTSVQPLTDANQILELDYKNGFNERSLVAELQAKDAENNKLKSVMEDLIVSNQALKNSVKYYKNDRDRLWNQLRAKSRLPGSGIPHADPKVRNNNTYAHREAPRENMTRDYNKSKAHYVAPDKYGSNHFWNLGLCHTHFCTFKKCQTPDGKKCELRHELTKREHSYIMKLTPHGPKFLHEIAVVTAAK